MKWGHITLGPYWHRAILVIIDQGHNDPGPYWPRAIMTQGHIGMSGAILTKGRNELGPYWLDTFFYCTIVNISMVSYVLLIWNRLMNMFINLLANFYCCRSSTTLARLLCKHGIYSWDFSFSTVYTKNILYIALATFTKLSRIVLNICYLFDKTLQSVLVQK